MKKLSLLLLLLPALAQAGEVAPPPEEAPFPDCEIRLHPRTPFVAYYSFSEVYYSCWRDELKFTPSLPPKKQAALNWFRKQTGHLISYSTNIWSDGDTWKDTLWMPLRDDPFFLRASDPVYGWIDDPTPPVAVEVKRAVPALAIDRPNAPDFLALNLPGEEARLKSVSVTVPMRVERELTRGLLR
jgi:hypothetical protein